jgi:cell division protein ZapA
MPHVTVNIGGRPYRLACGEGEEAHLERLAHMVEAKIEGFRGSFGEIGDQRIAVMAAITLADELVEAERKLAAYAKEIERLRHAEHQQQSVSDEWVVAVSDTLVQVAQRVEAAATALNGPQKLHG